MKRPIWGVLSALLLASGCGVVVGHSEYDGVAMIPVADLAEARVALRAAYVGCGVGKKGLGCPDHVGMLAMVQSTSEGYSVGLCTATLISPTVIATNSHCVPADLKFEGMGCEGRGDFVLPETAGKPEERAGCRRILKASRLLAAGGQFIQVSPDYAFIEVDRALEGRQNAQVSAEGLPDELAVTIYKMDPQGKGVAGTIRRTSCVVTQRSAADPMFDHAYRRIGTLTRCEGGTAVQHGNSGSLVLDKSGAARAILQGGSDQNSGAPVWVTNLACVAGIPGYGDRPVPAECGLKNGPDRRDGADDATLLELLRAGVRKSAVARWAAGAGGAKARTYLDWLARPLSGEGGQATRATDAKFVVAPACYRAAALVKATGKKLATPDLSVPIGVFGLRSAERSDDWRSLSVELSVDSETRFKAAWPASWREDAQARRPIAVSWGKGGKADASPNSKEAELLGGMPLVLEACAE